MSPQAVATQLTLKVERKPSVIVVHCQGKLTAEVSEMLYDRVTKLISETRLIILDLTDLAYADSRGLGSLVRVYATTKAAGCELQLVNLGKRIRDLLSLTHLLSVFSIAGENPTNQETDLRI